MKKLILVTFLVSAISFAQKPIFTTAKVKSATVYFNAAELQQTTSVNLPIGTSEIVIKNVANSLNENTIQIGVPNTVTVLSAQFSDDYMSEYEIDETNPAIKKVRDSISYLNKESQKIQNQIATENKTIAILDRNQIVAGSNTGLNVAELSKLMDYYKEKNNEILANIVALNEKNYKIILQVQNLNKKLQLNTQKEEKASDGKLVLQVMNEVAGNINFEINYITNTASWTPFYDLRAESVKEPIDMMYKAQAVQNSGIDWKKVKLTLSSGNPNQNNQAPILGAWFLRYGEQYGYFNNADKKMNSIQSAKAKEDDDVSLDEVVVVSSGISRHTSINENQLNVSFDIDIPYDILSNGKVHSVALKELKLPATYKYYAAPRVDKEAFLLAEIKDYSKYNLLPGEANIIFEGMYVGKTTINPNQTTDTLNLSMGRDKKINIKREKVVDKSGTKFLSAYKEQTFTYDLTVRNNKKEEIQMLLKDQYPLSTDKEISIELLDDGNAKVNKETGILTWDLKLSPNETKKIRISYKVRYPKDKIIDNL
ncbi:DUF4139 domain-containing protein [Flavobacterium aquatile]|uniref:Membrane protein n=1 Tax=Flavobacterium aquatile LMG 4008 = ATCC 11947 TaxID=1453498 RepID=A0A095V264_9FLAO|nr:DUF4139 domain-containing protein [Flavobacterium aquatile]KGD68950.1 membrane protein [Flavobacterium aquatile LMG 4008 = ATCC 11947]OXA65661.1 hypothetical protein B0A61_13495 [Flavobacterium aquatile LMG 4008 = ATCC 11947]GEC79599.1 hypothetical protein FAQ01_24690 [Flavobacterium aquatile]